MARVILFILFIAGISYSPNAAFGADIDFSVEKSCYSEGDNMKLNAVYTGSGTVSAVQWTYTDQIGSNLFILASTCDVAGVVPGGFPDRSRMTFDCDLTTNTFTLTLKNLKKEELDKTWGATFSLSVGGSPAVQEKNFTFCINAVEKVFIHDNRPALKGSNIQLVCQSSMFSVGLQVFKTDNRLPSSLSGFTSLTICTPSFCLATTVGRYTFSADSSNVFINITNVNRSEDQKWWTCVVGDQRKDLLLNVITVPASLQYENPPSQSQDLAENAVQLKCSTDCCYPQPAITWYYSESGRDNLKVWASSGTTSDTTTECSDSEKKYSSTLSLSRYTIFPGNLQKTVKFKCSIQSFTGMSGPLYTSYSTDIQFAGASNKMKNKCKSQDF